MATIRVRDDVTVCVVFDFDQQSNRVVQPGALFDADDPFVKANAWAFVSDVEEATAAPGRKRAARRKTDD